MLLPFVRGQAQAPQSASRRIRRRGVYRPEGCVRAEGPPKDTVSARAWHRDRLGRHGEDMELCLRRGVEDTQRRSKTTFLTPHPMCRRLLSADNAGLGLRLEAALTFVSCSIQSYSPSRRSTREAIETRQHRYSLRRSTSPPSTRRSKPSCPSTPAGEQQASSWTRATECATQCPCTKASPLQTRSSGSTWP